MISCSSVLCLIKNKAYSLESDARRKRRVYHAALLWLIRPGAYNENVHVYRAGSGR